MFLMDVLFELLIFTLTTLLEPFLRNLSGA